MRIKRRNNNTYSDDDGIARSNDQRSDKQLASLRALVASVQADLRAEVARRASDQTEADLRFESLNDQTAGRVTELERRHDAELRLLKAATDERFSDLRTAQSHDVMSLREAVAALSARVDEQHAWVEEENTAHQAALVKANAEQESALAALDSGVSHRIEQLTASLHAAEADRLAVHAGLHETLAGHGANLTAEAEALRQLIADADARHSQALSDSAAALDSRLSLQSNAAAVALDAESAAIRSHFQGVADAQSSALQAESAALRAHFQGVADAQSSAMQAESGAISGRITALVESHDGHIARLTAAEDAHQRLSAGVDVLRHQTSERLCAVDAAIDSLDDRVARADRRITEASATASRVEALGDRVGEFGARLSAAEAMLRQQDDTDVESQLDRMESFERFVAATDPDQFAVKGELDELRMRMNEFEKEAGAQRPE